MIHHPECPAASLRGAREHRDCICEPCDMCGQTGIDGQVLKRFDVMEPCRYCEGTKRRLVDGPLEAA